MNMKKILAGAATGALILGAMVAPAVAKVEREAQSVDEIDVQANTTAPVSSNVALEDGVEYQVKVSGTYNAGDNIDADAQCSDKTTVPPDAWTESVQTYEILGENLLDLHMDGNHDWGACAADHVYQKTIVGDGTPVDFYIYDTFPSNNTGSLHVEISREWKNHGQYVSSQENKQEAAQSRVGMPVQSKGHTK